MAWPVGKVQLIFVKSKVYVHPSRRSADNISGFLYLYREQGATDSDIVVGWVPEHFVQEEKAVYDAVDMDSQTGNCFTRRPPMGGSFSWRVPLKAVFSIQHRPPNLGSVSGSILFNTRSMEEKLPWLFFHDAESQSTQASERQRVKNFDVFGLGNELFWGGSQFLEELGKYCVLERSTLESSVLLVNPTQDDLNNFSPTNVEKPSFGLKDLNKAVTEARWTVLETLARVTKYTREHVNRSLGDSKTMKRIMANPDVQRVNEDFDSARVYLAKWAMGVQQEAEKNRAQMILNNEARKKLYDEMGIDLDKLAPEEIQKAHENTRPVSLVEWKGFFDSTGRLALTVDEVKDRIFHGGLSLDARPEAWLFLLGVYSWESSNEERDDLHRVMVLQYDMLKSQWRSKLAEPDEYFKDQKFRIDKDVQRTDRTLELYKDCDNGDEDDDTDADDDDVGKIKSPHLRILRDILLTFNEFNDKLGYVQGMNDLLSPLYVTLQDEVLAFWCFSKFMDRMERNFLSDQRGMKDQMTTLNELVQFMLPDLYIHLEKCDSNNLFFMFRMLLVWYKREFEWNDTLHLWEILWTDFYSSQFHLFVALAILQKNESIVIQHLTQFDEVLKYFNELQQSSSVGFQMTDLLTRSELLFLKFRNTMRVMESYSSDPNVKSPVNEKLKELLSREIIIQKERQRVIG
jgi:hypothetical protein